MIVILGAGLTGLSAAYYLKGTPYAVFEAEQRPGGLCRSVHVDGFTFDYTGHLLHTRNSSTRRLLDTIVPGTFVKKERNAAVFFKGTYVPYPFQANTFGLPKETAFECVHGFIEAWMKRGDKRGGANFQSWVKKTFGPGFSKHFFIPYNEKFWQMDLRKLTSDWASWSIPRPTLQEVIRGSLGMHNSAMGYNVSFYYPRRGGIEILPETLSDNVKNLALGKKAVGINLSKKRVRFADGDEAGYSTLVSTVPLPRLLTIIEDLPAAYAGAASRLSRVRVHNVNIGVNRPGISDYHWTYFPEPEYPFYRVGCYSNISPALAPRKTSSLYVEISSDSRTIQDPGTVMEASIEGLRRCGILKKKDKIIAQNYIVIDCGYVVYNLFRERKLADILHYLKRRKVVSAGRYGSWMYASMEDALLQGKETARALRWKK